VLDSLEIDRADMVGNSQGGMIAQRLALGQPERARSLILMSTIADFTNWQMDPEVFGPFMIPPPSDREGYAEWFVNAMRPAGTPGVAEDLMRELGGRSFDRGIDQIATSRQMAAIGNTGPWHEQLPSIRIPTLVIHGEADRVFPLRSAQALADAIPGARL